MTAPFTGGALVAIDVAFVDRVWADVSAEDAIAGVSDGTLTPARPSGPIPGEPAATKLVGLDVALRSMTQKKLLDQTLVENLKAKRALGIPWRWFTTVPDLGDETRADNRLMALAEITRLPHVTAAEIMAVGSVVERRMVGGDEATEAFSRWGSDVFAQALGAVDEGEIPAIVREGWGDTAPLLAALELETDDELWAGIGERLAEIRSVVEFARDAKLEVIPRTKASWKSFLRQRAESRGA